MQIDVEGYLGAVVRSVEEVARDGRAARRVVLTRSYATTAEDLWEAVTSAERIPRWFLPVTGDLRVGGRFQLEGNAGGEILACDAPRHLAVTWEFGGQVSWVDVHVAAAADGAQLTLEHVAVVDDHWERFGPGATGVGWDLALMGLGLHLGTGEANDPEDGVAWMTSEEGRAFIRGSSRDWGRAAVAAGTDEAVAGRAEAQTTAFYTGEESAGG